jgi:hypothetical protein
MCELTGETHDLNRGCNKDGRGILSVRGITLLIPNYKAKHRSTGKGMVWKYELRYLQNRWYTHGRPRYRRIMKALGLRK